METVERAHRQQQERKLRVEQRLKEICDELNVLKEKLSSSDVSFEEENSVHEPNESVQIDTYEDELSRLRAEIQAIERNCAPVDAASVFDLLDQAISTQVELIKSFLNYLTGKVAERRKEMRRRDTLRVRLAECEANLTSYVELARQLLTANNGFNNEKLLVENRNDLQARIESIESIENSIRDSFKQIAEIRSDLQLADRNVKKFLFYLSSH